MNHRHFTQASIVDAPVGELFAWHARPGALQRLTPPWQPAEVVEQKGTIRDGDKVTLRVRLAPLIWKKWIAEHEHYIDGHQFCDRQVAGPFAQWEHFHQFEAAGAERAKLSDRIEYALPLAAVTNPLLGWAVDRKLRRMFIYRHRVTRDDVIAHRRFAGKQWRILMTGASGFVGSALVPMLTAGGHTVSRLTRKASKRGGIRWDPNTGEIDAGILEGYDAVIHLAGENIAGGRWTDERKREIRESRERGTRLLATTLAKLRTPPKVFVCASAVGYYGDRGDETLDERSAPGAGFLADVCREWEAAAQPARDAGIRTVNARFGVILSPAGGALPKMLTPFKLGAGGKIGSGKQWMSWVALDDVVGAIHHVLFTEALRGAVNVVGPQPVTNAEFTRTLGRVLVRPTIFPLPAFAAKLALGEMADQLLLASQRVLPKALEASDYPFRCTTLEDALRHVLGRVKAA